MRYIRQLCCVSLLCLSGSAVAANVRLQVEGLSGQLEKNVRAQLSTIESDENSWLIDGGTPIDDVMRVLDIDEFPQSGNYETIGGFMMFMLRKIPKRTDSVKFAGYKFEVVDIDNYRIDQLLVTRIDSKATALSPKLPDAKDKEESVA